MRVTVYCASSARVDPAYFEAAEQLGNALVDAGAEVNYGGGNIGLMGRLADTILKRGGRITGIIPQFMKDVEFDHPDVEEMICVPSMHERKRLFLDKADAVVEALGGRGITASVVGHLLPREKGMLVAEGGVEHPLIHPRVDPFWNAFYKALSRDVDQ